MSITEILFYAFSGVLLVSAIGVITSRNPVHAALFLVFSFFNSAVLWILLEAEFLAIVLVLVYVGAVMVLFLFVVMMLDIKVAEVREGFTRYAPLSDQRLTCYVGVESLAGGHALKSNVHFVDAAGRLLAVLDTMEASCTNALNRLSGTDTRNPSAQ